MSSLAPWTEIAPGLLAHDERRGMWSLRTHAVRLTDGGWAVVSPTRRMDDAAHAALTAVGPVAILVAPNHYHHLGLGEWRERHPGARIVCTEVAQPRLKERQPALTFAPLPLLAERLPAGTTVVEPPGLRTGELWLRLDLGARGIAWLVSDAFFNAPALPEGLAGLAFRLTDTAPGLKVGRTFAWLAVQDTRYRPWLEAALERDRPRLLLPGHGDVLESDALPELLVEAVRKRL